MSTRNPERTGPSEESVGSHAHSSPPPSPKPVRSAPWWMIVVVVVIALASGWIGMRFGPGIVDVIRANVPASAVTHADGESGESKGSPDKEAGATTYYTCGMHPWVILPKPGDCPICHMKLTPLDPAKFTGEVAIDPVVVQNIGVRIGQVTEGPLVRTIRTVGNVDYDETRVRDVNTKVAGWIEKLYVDYVGAPVEEGEPLFDVYSPTLYQAQEEYLLALKTQKSVGAPGAGVGGETLDLVESARTKLELFDVTPEQIEELAKAGEPSRTLGVVSPYRGIVIDKHANEGMKIDPGMRVFRIADLSHVWVQVTLYESQLPYVSVGERAVMTLPYIPGQRFEGRVAYIYPYVNTQTREVEVRLEFENPAGVLKPGMFATIELRSTLREHAVLAPRSAIITTGERSVAFVSLGKGRFEPRAVRLGVETGEESVEVLDGLKPGELVVTSGQFLLDSESRVREALAKLIRGDLASDQRAEVAVVGRSELDALPETVSAGLTDALGAYFAIGDRLASDTLDGVPDPARRLAGALDGIIGAAIPSHEHFWHQHTEAATARGEALGLATETNLGRARERFADLSVALDTLLRATGVPPGFTARVQSLHCPMFREGQGGSVWLQAEGSPRNPFFGASMLECFDRREVIPTTGAASGPTGASPSERPSSDRGGALDGEARELFGAALDAYLDAQDMLTRDQFDSAVGALRKMRDTLRRVKGLSGEGEAAAREISTAISSMASDPESIRAAFAKVSDAVLLLGRLVGNLRGPEIFHAYCPMVKHDWVQRGEEIRNPYDPEMLSCGVIKGPFGGRDEQ